MREAGLEFQFFGIYGIFETFIRVKRSFCIKYSNISNCIFYPYHVKGSGKVKNKGNRCTYSDVLIQLLQVFLFPEDFLLPLVEK